MAELPEFLSLTNRQSDDLFCLPFNISLQRGQRPTIFLAESIKEKSSARWENRGIIVSSNVVARNGLISDLAPLSHPGDHSFASRPLFDTTISVP